MVCLTAICLCRIGANSTASYLCSAPPLSLPPCQPLLMCPLTSQRWWKVQQRNPCWPTMSSIHISHVEYPDLGNSTLDILAPAHPDADYAPKGKAEPVCGVFIK